VLGGTHGFVFFMARGGSATGLGHARGYAAYRLLRSVLIEHCDAGTISLRKIAAGGVHLLYFGFIVAGFGNVGAGSQE